MSPPGTRFQEGPRNVAYNGLLYIDNSVHCYGRTALLYSVDFD